MERESTNIVGREDFELLCRQVSRLAGYLEQLERFNDPDGPHGWDLREITKIKREVLELVRRPATDAAPSGTSRKA